MVKSTQRSDVTMTESVWDYMKRLKQLRQPKSIKELWQILEAWNNLHTKFLMMVRAFAALQMECLEI